MTTHDAAQPVFQTGRKARPHIRADRVIRAITVLLLAVGAIAMLYPFMWMIFSSFKTVPDVLRIPPRLLPETWTLEAFQMVFGGRVNIWRGYLNSFFITMVVIVMVLFTSSLGGYVFNRLNFPGRRLVFYFVLATTMVPGMPRWLCGCDPYQIGWAMVQPIFMATCSTMRVTRYVSSPSGWPAPWHSVLPTGMMIRSLVLSRSLTWVMFMVCR
jgi:hypothetical protein